MWVLTTVLLPGRGGLDSPTGQQTTPKKVAIQSSHDKKQATYLFDRTLRVGQLKKVQNDPPVYHFNPVVTPSRSSYTRGWTATFEATAYSPNEPGLDWKTATGRRAGYGIIAVDPRVIPLGSTCFVEGYGYAIAADTGGAIKGHHIDVCYISVAQCNRWGRKKVVVHVFKEPEFTVKKHRSTKKTTYHGKQTKK